MKIIKDNVISTWRFDEAPQELGDEENMNPFQKTIQQVLIETWLMVHRYYFLLTMDCFHICVNTQKPANKTFTMSLASEGI